MKNSKLKLQFPQLTENEINIIHEWSKYMGYTFIYEKDKKAIVTNNLTGKIAYIQKVKGEIRLVFNNRWETLNKDMFSILRLLQNLNKKPKSKNLINFVLGSTELTNERKHTHILQSTN